MKSTEMTQIDLRLSPRAQVVEINDAEFPKVRSRRDAIKRCVALSGLTDKEVSGALGVDKAQWSRFESGIAHFNPEWLHPLQMLCGNNYVTAYDAWMCKSELKPILTDIEAENVELRAELAKVKHEKSTIEQFVGNAMRGNER